MRPKKYKAINGSFGSRSQSGADQIANRGSSRSQFTTSRSTTSATDLELQKPKFYQTLRFWLLIIFVGIIAWWLEAVFTN